MRKLVVTAAYDQSPLAELGYHSEEEALEKLALAYATYEDREAWLTPADRIRILEKLGLAIEEQVEELALLAAREGGKPLSDSLVEIRRAITGVDTARAAIPTLTGTEVPMGLNSGSARRWAITYREVRGVVLAISAFNHPFNLLIHQVITAVAAGAPVLIKPASATPLSCEALVKLLRESGLEEKWCQILHTPKELTQKLAADQRIAFLSFIGSKEVGWMLRSHLAPGAVCALEHGGVAPVIVDESADLEDTVPLLTKGAFYHAGQVCVSVQRVYAHESIIEELSSRLVKAALALKVGDPSLEETEVGPLIWPQEVLRVENWVQAATKQGAKLLCGGHPLWASESEKKSGAKATLFEPTILLEPNDEALVSRQEVFGPVLCLYSYRKLDKAIERANLGDAYFQAAFFTNRLDRALDVGRRLHGTAVMINDHTAFRVDWMPFGGHRQSGLGMGGIEHSMKDMTIERMLVMRQK